MVASTTQRVLVSYSAPQTFLSSGNWDQVQAALLSQLPLRNIHWKSATRTSIRTIQELDVTLVPLDGLRDEHTSQVPVTLLEKPLLNVYVVMCEDTDIDTYRTTVKKQIKDWHTAITTRKNQEWLILHVVRPDARLPSGNFFQMKGSVLEKMKADFNVEKRDRCVQVTWSTGYGNPAAWAEPIKKIKDGLLSAFESAVSQREDEVKRSESQRQMPGWNFCTFFILKESLANSYEGVNLFEDALLQYDELEASFHTVLKEKNLSWFGTLITPTTKDDSSPLLSITKKPYRDLILANTISVFDFRIYILARQCELLARTGRIDEVSRRVSAFLGVFGRRLREVEITLPPFFVESWAYSSALSVVEQCDLWSSALTMEGNKLAAFNAGKGQLLELARNQLDIVGTKVGHLPSRPPFSNTSSPAPTEVSQAGSTRKISNTEILAAIDDRDTFYELYVGTTNRAINMYGKARRRKFALKLHGSLAALDVHRGRLAAAIATYNSLPAHYAPHMWTSLQTFMLSQALDTHSELGKEKDTEWIHVLLSFLKTYIETQGSELLIHEEDKVEYISQLVQAMKIVAAELQTDLPHVDHPAISIQVSPDARIAEERDGSFIDVIIRNHLPCLLPADEVTVVLGGRDAERLKFMAPIEGLAPGKTELVLFCPTPSFGTYVLDSSQVRVSRILFQWTHWKALTGKTLRQTKETPVLVRIPRDLLALDVVLRQPHHIELGRQRSLLVSVSTGRNEVLKVNIKLTTANATFRMQDAFLDKKDLEPASLEATDEAITLLDINEHSTVAVSVPHSDATTLHAMKVNIDVEYVTTAEPSIMRKLRLSRMVVTTLPISVNVEDFFRGTRLFSKFTIATTSHQHVRIASARLDPPPGGLEGVKIVAPSTKNRGVVSVTPAQPANFLFHLDSTGGPVHEPLTLVIKYRMLREEVESLVEDRVDAVLADSHTSPQDRVTLVSKLVEALEQDANWVEMYGITGELNVPGPADQEEGTGELLGKIKKLLHEHRHPVSPEGDWREIKIPVDVPYMTIVAAVHIRILSTPFATGATTGEPLPLYAGQPISAELTIRTSFHWGPSAHDKDRRYMMRFDVAEMAQDWLVSGRKRGDFVAMDDATYTISITLIALHHGGLVLPQVNVTALPLAGEVTMGSMAIPSTETYQVHGAEKVLVLPRGGRSTFVVGMGSS